MTEQTQEQKYTVNLYLKHGHVISFTCTEFNIKRNGFGDYTEASWSGTDRSLSFKIDDLIAYTSEKVKVEDK